MDNRCLSRDLRRSVSGWPTIQEQLGSLTLRVTAEYLEFWLDLYLRWVQSSPTEFIFDNCLITWMKVIERCEDCSAI